MACSRVNFSSNFASSSPLMPTSQIFSLFYYSFPLNTIFSSSSPCHYQHWHLFYVTLSYICFSFSYFFIALFPSLYTLSLPNSCIIVSLSILCLSVLPLSWLRVVSLFLLWALSKGQNSDALKMSSGRRQEFKAFVRISYSDLMTA